MIIKVIITVALGSAVGYTLLVDQRFNSAMTLSRKLIYGLAGVVLVMAVLTASWWGFVLSLAGSAIGAKVLWRYSQCQLTDDLARFLGWIDQLVMKHGQIRRPKVEPVSTGQSQPKEGYVVADELHVPFAGSSQSNDGGNGSDSSHRSTAPDVWMDDDAPYYEQNDN